MPMLHGRVRSFDEEQGFGWIAVEVENDVWVHFSGIYYDPARFPSGFRFLAAGQKVAFDLRENPHSVEQAQVAASNISVYNRECSLEENVIN
ncbi:cold-shock protein [Cohnella yongneupensis]|uniref:Cold-shock protein n=1 Tax=Cohnella yongneupensis TaxID=425006 RepID=A0ABW0R0V4_9BACL